MPRGSSAPFNPLRLFTPIQLAFCLILFFLPWIELQCGVSKAEAQKMSKDDIEKARKEFGVDVSKPIAIVSQSGFQIATNDASYGSDFKKFLDKLKQAGVGGSDTQVMEKERKKDSNGVPILFAYPVFLIAGIALAFVLKPGVPRRLALVGCCAGAVFAVGVPAAVGFPMEQDTKWLKDQGKGGPVGGGGAKEKDKTKTESVDSSYDVRVSWQIPLYLTFLFLLGAAGTSFLDGGAPPRKPKRKVYDLDDDEEEERPRSKKRKVVDEEENENPPPRKPAGAAPASGNPFDFEDDPPKKNPRQRDDDEDEDDRPRRKKQRDD